MSDAKQTVLARLQDLRDALSREPISDTVTKARHQCDRLEHGIALAHPEGVRFAAHTLLRLLQGLDAQRSSPVVTEAVTRLQQALDDGHFPH